MTGLAHLLAHAESISLGRAAERTAVAYLDAQRLVDASASRYCNGSARGLVTPLHVPSSPVGHTLGLDRERLGASPL